MRYTNKLKFDEICSLISHRLNIDGLSLSFGVIATKPPDFTRTASRIILSSSMTIEYFDAVAKDTIHNSILLNATYYR